VYYTRKTAFSGDLVVKLKWKIEASQRRAVLSIFA